MKSKHLSHRALTGLNKIGDILCPGGADWPSFSGSGQIAHIDRALDYLPTAEVKDLGLLLAMFGLLPKPLLAILWALIDTSHRWPSGVGTLARTVRFGIRGIVFSLVFSGKQAHQLMGYDVKVYRGDLAK
jgi:hypothetical protein